MTQEQRREYYRNYMRRRRAEFKIRRDTPGRSSTSASEPTWADPTICAFCHIQIDGRVYRKGKARLHLVCYPLYAEREHSPRVTFPGVYRLGMSLRSAA
jgi:hypothetical protein